MTSRIVIFVLVTALSAGSADAQVTPAHRKQLKEVSASLGQVKAALRKKDNATARETFAAAEKAFQDIVADTGLEEDASVFRSTLKLLNARRTDLGLDEDATPTDATAGGMQTADGISFVRDVAPILTQKCVRCHAGNRARGGLDLSSFEAMKRGGDGGPLLVRGNVEQSQLIERIVTNDPEIRMPKGGQLFDNEIEVLTNWVKADAPFDGDSESTPLRNLSAAKKANTKVVVPKPTGNETVSFVEDIAPMFNRICLSCHSGADPRGGLSLASFHDLMVGGDSGAVIIPGDAENSRLFRLVGGLELPRMPGNRSRIRRSEYAALKTWFEEGNTFDGSDAKANILSYIDTPEKQAARALAKRTAAEWAEAREQSTAELWKRGMPLLKPTATHDGSVFTIGNTNSADLDALAKHANTAWTETRSLFGSFEKVDKSVSLLVVDSNYAHKELAKSLANTALDDVAHAFATADGETRYAAVNLNGADDTTLSAEDRVTIAVREASLAARSDDIPRWLSAGLARATTVPNPRNSSVARQWALDGTSAVKNVAASRLFDDAAYDPADLDAVGYVVVGTLINNTNQKQVVALVNAIADGADLNAAFRRVFNQPPTSVATAVQRALR